MATKRDLVEAHSFNRRRLVTAFVSGAPGGREVEPVRYGRTLVGGLVLAVLLVAGAAVSGLLPSAVPDDWKADGVVIAEDSGARFVALDERLYPVTDTTSARLLLAPDGELEVTMVGDDLIAEETLGSSVGIPGAPDVLPEPDQLLQSGWTSCVDASGQVLTRLAATPGVRPSDDGALVVRSDTEQTSFVITGERRYALPESARDRGVVLRALGLDGSAERVLPGRWIDLFPLGAPLLPFAVPDFLERSRTPLPQADVVGTPVESEGRTYVLTRRGLAPVSPFAYALYTAVGPGASLTEVTDLSSGDIARIPAASLDTVPANWPEAAVTPFDGEGASCALLEATDDRLPVVRLAAPATDEVVYDDEVGASVQVDSGRGAVLRTTSGGVLSRGTVTLVDSSGTRYAVGSKGNEEDALNRLGYGEVAPVAVPLSWMDLFPAGPELSYENVVDE
jgi:type VII secretion protein EccB